MSRKTGLRRTMSVSMMHSGDHGMDPGMHFETSGASPLLSQYYPSEHLQHGIHASSMSGGLSSTIMSPSAGSSVKAMSLDTPMTDGGPDPYFLSAGAPMMGMPSAHSVRRSASDSALQGISSNPWREVLDTTTERVYYWNTFNGASQWEMPPDFEYHHSKRLIFKRPPRKEISGSSSVSSPSLARTSESEEVASVSGDGSPKGTKRSLSSSSLDSAKSPSLDEPASSSSSSPSTSTHDAIDESESTGAESPSKKRKDVTMAIDGSKEQQSGGESTTSIGSNTDDGDTDSSAWSVDSYYSAEDSDELKNNNSAWEELQVSMEDLSRLQRALYERGTSPALVALVTFGMRTTPFQKPSKLLVAVREKLNSHEELWNELRRYREALEPSTTAMPVSSEEKGMYVDKVGAHVNSVPGGHQMASDAHPGGFAAPPNDAVGNIVYPANYFRGNGSGSLTSSSSARTENLSLLSWALKSKSEMGVMREFMAFVVTRLQMVRDLCEAHERPLVTEHKDLLAACLRLWWRHANRYL